MSSPGVSRERVVSSVMNQLSAAEVRLPAIKRAVLLDVTTAVAAVTVVMVALLYLLLVGGLAWLALDYAIGHAKLLGASGSGGSAVVYMLISAVLLLVVVLLVKPALWFGAPEGKPHRLSRTDQPELYAYVDRLAELLGTPKPERIEVYLDANASASLAGVAMGLFSRRPVLSLGLSLVAGMDARRLTGVIAHEMAHFTQSRGTRFRLVIHAVNGWFARVVFERDLFDYWLARCTAVPVVGYLLLPVHLVLWVGRRVLWLFMMIAHAASGMVSRRGEYEADKLMAAVAGSDQVGLTLQQIALLGLCMDAVRDDLRSAYLGGRLADDVPKLTAARAENLTEKREQQLLRLVKLEQPAWHSTHPTLVQRSAAARRLKTSALVTEAGPASALFRGFEALCREQTQTAYRAMLGEEMQQIKLVPTAQILSEIDAAEQASAALGRFYQCQVMLTRPLLPAESSLQPPSDPDAACAGLEGARERMLGQAESYKALVDRLAQAEDQIKQRRLQLTFAKAGFSLNPAELGLRRSTPAAIRQALEAEQAEEQEIHEAMSAFDTIARKRLTTAVALLSVDEVLDSLSQSIGLEQAHARHAHMQAVVRVCGPLQRAMPTVRSLADACDALVALVQSAGQSGDGGKLNRAVDASVDGIINGLKELRDVLGELPYPFEHAEENISIGKAVVAKLPTDRKDLEQLVFTAGDSIERYETLVARCMAVSAETAEQVETALGFVQQDAPEVVSEFELFLQEVERGGTRTRDAAASENWLVPLAAAAAIMIGVFLAALGGTSIAPTVTSTVVPHHHGYQTTIVPSTFVDPSQGSRFFDPVRDWRIDNLPQPARPTFPDYRPDQPNQPWRSPGYNNPHDPNNDPNNRPGYRDPYQPNRQPGYNNPHSPNRHRPSHPTPSRPTAPSAPRPSPPSPGGPGF